MRNDVGFDEKFCEILARAPGNVPFDLGLLGLHQDAQRRLLRLGLCELVGRELVGEDRLVLLSG